MQPALWLPPQVNRNSIQSQGLALWWPGGSKDAPLETNRPTTFGTGATAVMDGEIGKAWSLDGTANGFLNVNPINVQGIAFNNARGHSVSAWVKPSTSLSTLQYAVNWTSGSLTLNTFAITTTGALVCAQDIAFGGATLGTFVTTAVANTWYHLAYTWQTVGGTSTHTMYLNGRQVATSTAAQHTGVIAQMDIGRRNDVGGVGNPFTGSVSDTRFYLRALSDAEIYQQWDPRTRWELYRPQGFESLAQAPSGVVTPITPIGTLTSAGLLARSVNKPVGGSQAPSGLLVRQPIKVYAGTLTSVGVPRLQTNKRVSGSLTSSGLLSSVKVATLSVAGSLSLSGILARKTNKLLTGVVTSAGILVRFVSRALAGTMGSSGALSRQTNNRITGTLALAGTFAQRTNKLLIGTLTDVGAVRQELSRTFTAALAPGGVVRKQVNKLLPPRGVHYDAHLPYDAHIPYDGAVAPLLFLDGSVQPVKLGAGGAQTLSVGGTLSSSGVLQKQVNKIVAGAVTLTGALARLPSKILPGTLGSSGALSRQTNKRITGTLTLVGTVAQRTNKLFVGTLTSAGSNVAVKITGTLQTLSVAGTLTLSGILTQIKKKFVTLTGALTSAGVLRRVTQKNLTGAVTLAGVVHFFLPRKFTGVLGLAGAAFKQANKALKRGLHYDAPIQYDAHIHYDSHETPMLFLKGSMTRDKSGVAGVFLFGTLNSSGLVSKLLNKALAGTLVLSGPIILAARRFITKFSRMVTNIQLDSRFTGLRHVASKIGVAVTTHAQTQRIVTKIAKKISIAPRVER